MKVAVLARAMSSRSVSRQTICNRFQQPPTVNHRQNFYLSGLNFIDDPVAVNEALAYGLVFQFRDNAADVRLHANRATQSEDFFHDALRMAW
jgi:hypothetical protein